MNARRCVIFIWFIFCVGILALIFHMITLKNYKPAFYPKDFGAEDGITAGSLRNPNSSILILYWTTVFGRKVNGTDRYTQFKFPFFSIDDSCPVKCELTTDKSRIGEVSGIVAHGRNTEEMPVGSQYYTVPWIYFVNESPKYTKASRDKNIMRKFSYLATYRLDSDFVCTQFYKPKLSKPIPFAEKTGFSVIIYTHCENVRTLYLHRLMKYMQIDSYGSCLRNKPRLPRTKTNLETLQAVMAKYKFALVIPNNDCDYYMTEKIYNALSSGSVPVWMGTDKIDEILQWGNLNQSIIKVRDFKSPQQLAKYLLWLSQNETEYNKFLKWKYEGFNFPKEYYSSKIGQWWDGGPMYCRVCMQLAKDRNISKSHLNADMCYGKERRTLEKWIRE